MRRLPVPLPVYPFADNGEYNLLKLTVSVSASFAGPIGRNDIIPVVTVFFPESRGGMKALKRAVKSA